MQKKLALACTLIHQPELIFLDEPTTGVDPVSRREFWDILTELHLEGITIFVSTPYMDEAERCSRVGLMYEGRIIICDVPEQIKGLVTGDLVELRTDNLRRAETLVASVPGVLEVQTYGDLLHVFVDSVEDRQRSLAAALEAEGIRVLGLRQTRPRMEEAFISLVRREMQDREDSAGEVGRR
jgi:ABC-2 type transport system ATP-binding protein